MLVIFACAFSFAAPAFAAGSVTPLAECVWDNGNGTSTAVFGYVNSSPTQEVIPVGAKNKVKPEPPGPDAGQTTVFLPGTHHNVFLVTYSTKGNSSNVIWQVQGQKVATADAGSAPECSTKPVPVLGHFWVALGALAVAAAVLARPRSRGRRLLVRAFSSRTGPADS